MQIPSSAVEMPPGDAIAVAMLDVQFGAMEFGSDSSTLDTSTTLDATNTKATVASSAPTPTPTAPTPTSVAASVASIMESYASSQPQQNNLANALGQTQKVGCIVCKTTQGVIEVTVTHVFVFNESQLADKELFF